MLEAFKVPKNRDLKVENRLVYSSILLHFIRGNGPSKTNKFSKSLFFGSLKASNMGELNHRPGKTGGISPVLENVISLSVFGQF